MIRSGSQLPFQFIPKVLGGVEVRDLCRPVKFFQTKLGKPFLNGPGFVRGIVMLKGDKHNTTHTLGHIEYIKDYTDNKGTDVY